jgi:uncharacterized repeat protein (TIGR03847 family)
VPIRELDPLTHLVADAVGLPGKRTFFLQAASGADQVTLLVEKEQVRRLAEALRELLAQLARDRPEDPDEVAAAAGGEMVLREPLVPDFRVGQLELIYDPERDRIVLAAAELRSGDEGDEDDEAPDVRQVHLVATRAQLRRMAEHGASVVRGGRPACPVCGNPMDPGGHVCPAMNGHRPLSAR